MKKFFEAQIAELHAVTWPTQKQAIHSMITVLSIMLLTGVALGLVDYFLNLGVLSFLGK